MRRFLPRLAIFVGLSLALTLSAFAQEAVVRHAFRHRLRECLSILDLTDQQKSDIAGILEAAKPTFEANVTAVRTARETLRSALSAVPPDACAIGADSLAVKAAVATLRTQRDAVRAQVLATLTGDQPARLQGCLDAPRPDAAAVSADPGGTPADEPAD
jgi:Spy/CpxP family protein refolding chaperone